MVVENAGSEGGSSSSATSSVAGGRLEEKPGKGPPPTSSFEDNMAAEADQVHKDMLLTVRSVLEVLSLQQKCGLLGVAPRESGLSVQTTERPGGAGSNYCETQGDFSSALGMLDHTHSHTRPRPHR